MSSPNRREFMQYTGGAAVGAFAGLPSLEGELAALTPDELDRSTPYIFLRLDGVPGDSTAKGHEGEIVCFACRWSRDDGAGSGSGRGRDPHRGHVTVLKAIDKATPILYEAAGGTQRFETATVALERPSADGRTVPYCVLRMNDVAVTSLESGQWGAESLERCVLETNGGVDIGLKTKA